MVSPCMANSAPPVVPRFAHAVISISSSSTKWVSNNRASMSPSWSSMSSDLESTRVFTSWTLVSMRSSKKLVRVWLLAFMLTNLAWLAVSIATNLA